ncbi:MAG: flavodoxin family protein, partial [Candidatus Geothermarchaeales archaeon]
KEEGFRCVVDDDMRGIYPKLAGADVLIFGTPLYWYGPTGKMKLMMDRPRPFGFSGELGVKKPSW